ncbi:MULTISPECIES: hypothetical protein [unclassified Vibrio]|uniref:hypothetical protein n=1 Tax=unclassified Vibrio TaxID=2614977 RepID=UPI000C862D1D|nr:hypothetical protein [Vibrio sp. 10N.261.54.E10]PMK06839.1 hypothetical protein BCU07_21110 [Vibrio sp. 10N.261.54.E10]
MHLVCKFISSSSLSTNDLQYVLTPDECIGLFSRARTPKNILAQLPSTLVQQITASAKKNVHSLLNAIRVELVKANWVCLSSNVRRSPLTSKQLASFPRLKLHVDRVSKGTGERVHKANYQQVVDDVPLARHYSFSPVEPSPEHKIVVEFAGQWSSNAACLMLGKTDVQKEKVTVGKPDRENKHRSLATFKDLEVEGKTLYIKIPCKDRPQPILLKLAEDLQPVDKESQMDEWDNLLVPVVPLHFPTGDHSDKSSEMFGFGFVYVVWNNEIWRELVIEKNGYFSDTDINVASTDSRPRRHADIHIEDSDTGAIHTYEPFKVLQNGEIVSKGMLNGSGEARIFNLVEEEIEIVLTEYQPPISMKVETFLSPVDGSTEGREAKGYSLPHIWVPYKVQGEPQDVYMFYSSNQLSNSQLSQLASDPGAQATKLVGLEAYSSEQSFKTGEGATRLLSVLPNAASNKQGEYAVLQSQLNQNVAAVYLNKLVELVFEYPGYVTLDESDDYFELKQCDGDWSQRVSFRQCAKTDKGARLISFSGWPVEVEEVDLVRGYLGNSRQNRDNQTVIIRQTPIADLLAYKSSE